jgi:peroxiredoxin
MQRLTNFVLRSVNGGFIEPRWQNHLATVLVFMHDGHCLACRQICRTFAELREQLSEWGANLLLIWRGEIVPEGCEGFLEGSSNLRRKWLGESSAGVLVVDRFGVVVKKWSAIEGFPSPEDVLAVIKDIALQCPE